MAYNHTYRGFPAPNNNPRMMNPPPNIHGPPRFNNNSPWRPPPERPHFNINSFMLPPHVVQRPNFPPNMFHGGPSPQVQRQHFTPDNIFSQEASNGSHENFPFSNNTGPSFQNSAQHFQGHRGRGRGFMGGHLRGQGCRGGSRGGMQNGNQNNNQNNFKKAKKQKVNKRELPENNVHFCDVCDRGFKTQDKYQEHVDGHIKCSYKDCPFIAAPKLVQLHTRMQHSSGIAKKIWCVESSDDINKWREERKRNFPTSDNVARKKQEREEKIARGEVLHTKEFGKMWRGRGGQRRGGRGHRGRGRRRWREYDKAEDNAQAADGSDSEGAPEEIVTRKSTAGDEDLGQLGLASETAWIKTEVDADTPETELQAQAAASESNSSLPVLSPHKDQANSLALLTSYGESSSDSQTSGDGCEHRPGETDTGPASESAGSPSKLVSPQKSAEHVTSLVDRVSSPSVAPQSQAELHDVSLSLESRQSALNGAGIHAAQNSCSPHKSPSHAASPSISSAGPTEASTSPGSVSGQHQKHNNPSRGENVSRNENVRDHNGKQDNKRPAVSEQGNCPPNKKKKEQVRQPVHRYTLLEKLLAPDMRRERNKVLQCVHYIVKNKFFEKEPDTGAMV